MMALSESDHNLSIDEIQTILTYWSEQIEKRKFSDDETNECIAMIQQIGQPVEWWLEHLVCIPDKVNDRYRKVMKLLLDNCKIDCVAHDAEINAMAGFSPATMTRRGKQFADWLRQD
jgi:hypothetical protein